MVRWILKTSSEWLVMGIGLFISLMIAGAVLSSSGNLPESDAMKVCQLSHSHDVCFQTLNR